MKIYISVDMEGMAGICDQRQEKDDSVRFRKAMQQEVEWVIEGIQKSKKNEEITEITVVDSHGYGRNISYDLTDLDDRISLISGCMRSEYMMAGLDVSYDMVFLIGYHAGAGETEGNMDHSYSSRSFYNVTINGEYMNESTLNGAYAGYFNIPVTLIVGDSGLYKQLYKDGMMPNVEFVTTKEPLSWVAAKYKAKGVIKREIIDAVDRVLSRECKDFPIYKINGPYHLQIDFLFRTMADRVSQFPGVQKDEKDGRIIRMEFDDYKKLYNTICMMCIMTSNAYPFDV